MNPVPYFVKFVLICVAGDLGKVVDQRSCALVLCADRFDYSSTGAPVSPEDGKTRRALFDALAEEVGGRSLVAHVGGEFEDHADVAGDVTRQHGVAEVVHPVSLEPVLGASPPGISMTLRENCCCPVTAELHHRPHRHLSADVRQLARRCQHPGGPVYIVSHGPGRGVSLWRLPPIGENVPGLVGATDAGPLPGDPPRRDRPPRK